jgi:hypothetical protein
MRNVRFSPWTLGLAMVLALPIAIGFYLSLVWTIGIVLGLCVVFALFLLFVSKTKSGEKVGQKIALKLYKTRVGKRMARSQLRAQAKKQGVALFDITGRERSELELQLDLFDTPETRLIRQQLKAMNPVQRAQKLREMEAHAEAARAAGMDSVKVSDQVRPPGIPRPSGKPIQGPPRARSRKRRRRS